MDIPLTRVKSSNVHAVGYHEPSRTLRVQFKNGGTYDYAEVPAGIHRGLMRAKSVGGHFHQHIKPKYKHKQLEEEK